MNAYFVDNDGVIFKKDFISMSVRIKIITLFYIYIRFKSF